MLQWTAEGRIRLFVDSRFPFDRVPDAFAHFQSRGVRGKILIHVSGDWIQTIISEFSFVEKYALECAPG